MIGYLRSPQRFAWVASLTVIPSLAVLCGGKSEKGTPVTTAGKGSGESAVRVETLITGLEIPWEIEFAQDGRAFITERPGRVKIFDMAFSPLATQSIPGVKAVGEGGLLGMALHPKFAENHWVYLYLTYEGPDEKIFNRVVRFVESGNALEPESGDTPKVIFDAMPGSGVHNGGRIKFGPDGKLYIAAGDSARKELAQDLTSLAGKIHRINDDGTIPADNPFPDSSIWSYGHRNPQGLTWDSKGRMYEAEHGPSGFDGPGGYDEANAIRSGKNYGWPKYGETGNPALVDPLFLSIDAVAPSGCVLYTGDRIPSWKGNLFLAMLRGQHLRRVVLEPSDPTRRKSDEILFNREFGRLRDIVQGPDGLIYILTSNRDGRAQTPFPTAEDDRLLRIGASE
ncbi:MAG: PQQ-dependent sugar dehydrogenase [Nitrospirae bacterium]|nr:PQQ-dependent sugar dehydrogenase [Nitrospirota bacterium]